MNKYFQENPPQILSPSYAYPASADFPCKKIIVQLDKNKSGGQDFSKKIKIEYGYKKNFCFAVLHFIF
jgi:hypothetical protein